MNSYPVLRISSSYCVANLLNSPAITRTLRLDSEHSGHNLFCAELIRGLLVYNIVNLYQDSAFNRIIILVGNDNKAGYSSDN